MPSSAKSVYGNYRMKGMKSVGLRTHHAMHSADLMTHMYLLGPSMIIFFVLDTRTMEVIRKVPKSLIVEKDHTLIILDASGTPDVLQIVRFDNHDNLNKTIYLS